MDQIIQRHKFITLWKSIFYAGIVKGILIRLYLHADKISHEHPIIHFATVDEAKTIDGRAVINNARLGGYEMISASAINASSQDIASLTTVHRQDRAGDVDRVSAVIAVNVTSSARSSLEGGQPVAEPEVRQISGQASTASRLLGEANSFIKAKFQRAFTGYNEGRVSPGAYINVKKFNDALFEHAATDMITKAKDSGIDLNKDDVLSSLRQANTNISNIQFDNAQRQSALGGESVYTALTDDDIDALTNAVVDSTLRGEEAGGFETLAFDIGVARRFNALTDMSSDSDSSSAPSLLPDSPSTLVETHTSTDPLISNSTASLKAWGFNKAVADFFAKQANKGDDTTLSLVQSLASHRE